MPVAYFTPPREIVARATAPVVPPAVPTTTLREHFCCVILTLRVLPLTFLNTVFVTVLQLTSSTLSAGR